MEKYKVQFCIALIFSVLFVATPRDLAAFSNEIFPFTTSTHNAEFVKVTSPDAQSNLLPSPTKKKPRSKSSAGKGKKVTFETYEENYQKACDFYNRQMFISAARIFEELYPLSLGTPRADSVLFLFADCYYQNRDYEMAAFHFKEYAGKYSTNPRAEDAHYKAILALSHCSPEYSLDQTETYYVIEEIQAFIRQYPHSSHMEECNQLLDKMRNKLAQKQFEILKLYYDTENYKAAQIIAKNFFKEYSSSTFADAAYAILVKNNYEYAQKSVESKKVERYNECIEAYQNLKINYPTSPFVQEVEKYATDAKNKINKTEIKKSKKKIKNED